MIGHCLKMASKHRSAGRETVAAKYEEMAREKVELYPRLKEHAIPVAAAYIERRGLEPYTHEPETIAYWAAITEVEPDLCGRYVLWHSLLMYEIERMQGELQQ